MVLLSSQQVWSELNEGTRCYVKAKSDNQKGEILVLWEFLDEFLEEMLKLPLKREVDFFIDVVLGVGPMSVALYRMVQLEELKK